MIEYFISPGTPARLWLAHHCYSAIADLCCCKETSSTAGWNQGYFLPALHPKLVFKKNSVMQYTPSTLDAIQFAQHTLARLLFINTRISHSMRLLEMRKLLTEKQLCWFQHRVGKKYEDFILSSMAFPYSNMCYFARVRVTIWSMLKRCIEVNIWFYSVCCLFSTCSQIKHVIW